jgi:hypothetical protein
MRKREVKQFQQQRARRKAYVKARNAAARNTRKTGNFGGLMDVHRAAKRPGNYMEALIGMAVQDPAKGATV